MTTRDAFMQLLNTRGIYSTIGLTKGRVGAIKDLIKNQDKWPTIDKMEELLLKDGVPVLQEKEWGELKISA